MMKANNGILDYLTRLPRTSWSARIRLFDDGTARSASTRITCGRRWLLWDKSSYYISNQCQGTRNAASVYEREAMGLLDINAVKAFNWGLRVSRIMEGPLGLNNNRGVLEG